MKPDEINRAIAELCGWKIPNGFVNYRTRPDGVNVFFNPIEDGDPTPNYYASLDACAEFEQTITYPEMDTAYAQNLLDVIKAEFKCEMPRLFALITATAPQRCESFLRIHNKWREE